MAKPQKAGLDYFPFDVGLLKDKKLRRAKMKYGYLATEIYIALLTLLYSDKGYYIPYATQNEKDDCIWYVQDCLQGKYQPEANTIAEVIEELKACELFSGDLYPENITSKRSQAVYYSATVERKSIVINPAIWLLNLEEMKDLSAKHSYYLSIVNRPINEENRPIDEENRPIEPQRKEEKRKEEKRREDDAEAFVVLKDIHIDCPLRYSCQEYEKAMCEREASDYAKKNFLHLSKLHKHWDKLITGYYRDRDKERPYTATELEHMFESLNGDKL